MIFAANISFGVAVGGGWQIIFHTALGLIRRCHAAGRQELVQRLESTAVYSSSSKSQVQSTNRRLPSSQLTLESSFERACVAFLNTTAADWVWASSSHTHAHMLTVDRACPRRRWAITHYFCCGSDIPLAEVIWGVNLQDRVKIRGANARALLSMWVEKSSRMHDQSPR